MTRVLHFFILYVLWILLTWSFTLQELIAGAVISFMAEVLLGDIFPYEAVKVFYRPRRLFWLFCYMWVFLWAMVKANFDVAYRVLNIYMPIKPGIVKVRTNLKSNMARTFLANSITLTPGTMTVDMIDDHIYIHWINVVSADIQKDTEIIVGSFEKYLERIFE
jgi:multicomponent Na+:H+ antiporter subunit E